MPLAQAARAAQDALRAENAKLLDSSFQAAFRIITSEKARAAFDLSQEKDSVRERYGMNRFGQCCLLARRLVESGVSVVTLPGRFPATIGDFERGSSDHWAVSYTHLTLPTKA